MSHQGGSQSDVKVIADPPIALSDPRVLSALTLLEQMNAIVPLSRFHFVRDHLDELLFTYRIDAADGRVWRQDIHFDVPNDPGQTFNVTAFWRLTEFAAQRPLRDAIVQLTSSGLREMDVKWSVVP